jgi:predicted transcriptional regulator
MAVLQIPDHLEEQLYIAAACSGRSKEELAAEILASHFEDESLPLSAFTDEQLARLKNSIKQLNRGEFVTSEEVERKFDAWFAKQAAR